MSLLDTASLIVTPNGYKASKLYSVKPTDASGDMVVSRGTTATRVNSSNLIESVDINVPRLDYTLGSCPSILVEPQRTNVLTYSEQFDNAAWVKSSVGSGLNPVVTSNISTSPSGNNDADRIVFNTTLSTDISQIVQSISLTVSSTGSVYLKAFASGDVGKIIAFRFNSAGYTLVTLTNTWQRFSATATASTSFDITLRPQIGTSTGSVSVLAWGAQLEAGSNATSYIPTTTLIAGTTRNADVISKTGITTLIGQTQGTIFMDLNFTNVGVDKYIIVINNTANTNSIAIRRLSTGAIRIDLTATTSSGTTSQSSAVLANGNYKIAYRYISGSIKLYINGALSFTETPTFTFGAVIDNIKLGMSNGNSEQLNDRINSFQLYQTALTHDQCIDLTN